MKNNYRLPVDYNSRIDYLKYVDGHDSLNSTIYQPLVYKSAFEIVKKTGAKYLIDIGCGDGVKVAEVRDYSPDCKVIMIDHEFIINNISKKYDFAEYMTADFDVQIPDIDEDKLKDSVIICSDVIEHLLKPEILIEFLMRCKGLTKAIVLSTPDRAEERGLFDYGPPANPYHVREWTLDEFTRMLMDYGFTNRLLAGLTISNDLNNVKATLLCIISKYFEYEPISNALNQNLACQNEYNIWNLNSITAELDFREFEDDTWYLLNNDATIMMPLMLRVPINEQISLADNHGFNVISKTKLTVDIITKDGMKIGKSFMHINSADEPIAAVKGSILNEIFSGKSPNLNIYPFNIIGLTDSTMQENYHGDEDVHLQHLGNWHENITRKNFIVELAFGGKVK